MAPPKVTITADDPRARFCQLDGCGALIAKTAAQNWRDYSKRRFCSQACSSTWRRAQPCPRCIERGCCAGQDWYGQTRDGRVRNRACRCCKNRGSVAWQRANPRPRVSREVSRPRPVPVPAGAPAQPPQPVWRPSAPGWPAIPGGAA